MTDRARHRERWGWCGWLRVLALAAFPSLAACKSEPHNYAAIDAYYGGDFSAARDALREDALAPDNEQTILDNTRLGLASLADDDLDEAESALGRSFELLSTAGLNKDKTVAAVFDHEGVRIWKGEPFEQALTYHYVALLYALKGDWENVRAAAANALFRLTDFGADQNAETMARKAAEDDQYLEHGYTAVDTNFALGLLMQALGSDLSGASGENEQYDAALKINGDLKPIVECLRTHDYDTLLVVDCGRGPQKQSYGTDDALVHFVPLDEDQAQLTVKVSGRTLAKANAVCDVNAMAEDHRWNNLEDVRKAKSFIGNALLLGGAITTAHGADRDSGRTMLAGLGVMAAGLLTKAGARADTRYCEFMPQRIFIVPLTLGETNDISVRLASQPGPPTIVREVTPGTPRRPAVVYVRMLDTGMPHGRRVSYWQ